VAAVGAIRQPRARSRRPDIANTIFLVLCALVLLVLIVLAIRRPAFFFQVLVFGVADGAIYALVAIGYTMVYGIIELINFAHGDVFTLGAFFAMPLLGALGLNEGQGFTAGSAVVLAVVFLLVMGLNGLVNVVIERVAYRPLRNAPKLAPLITAIGMSFVLEGLIYIWRGAVTVHFPDLLPGAQWTIGGVRITVKDIFVALIAILLVSLLTVFVSQTRLGKAMRATAQDRDAAQLMGINIDRTIAATFFIGAALAGAGGVVWGLYFNNVRFDLGFQAGLIAFTAAVFGGIGNIQGAAIGGLVIGIIAAFSDGFMSPLWTPVVVFSILILVLVFRPTGILGMRVPEK
jgi:branched-chain amino acid transport system permease protein